MMLRKLSCRPWPKTINQVIQMRKLISVDESTPVNKRLTSPCSDCPMRRDALPGWLGGYTAEQYAHLCHSDLVIDCHSHSGSSCAGVSIYRRNTCKWEPAEQRLEADHEKVFSNRMQFLAHHERITAKG